MSAHGPSVRTLQETIALGCRILAAQGLVEGTLGHISARVDGERMLIRGRAPQDRGLLFTEPEDVRLVDFDGAGDEGSGHALPNELAIHGETYRLRPGAHAVVHAHPPAVLLCGLADLALRPVFGAYNMPAMRIGVQGVPVYRRSVLIRRPELAHQMLEAMGDRPLCLLRGHGITVTGDSVEQAVVRAIDLNVLATVTLELARLGREPEPICEEDLAELPDLGSAFNDETVWRHYAAKLAASSAVLGAGAR